MKRKWILRGLTLFFLALFLYAAFQLGMIWRGYHQSDVVYETAQVEFLKAPELETEFISDDPITWPTFAIDFAQLQQVNAEVTGWLWIYDTVVNYPLVQSKQNNDAYLYKTYDGTSNSAGSIFVDYRNARDFSDDNTVIYGHNMKNGKMFASLKKFGKQDFYENHREFYILTPEGNRRYEIVAAFQTDALSDIYDRTFANGAAKEAWVQEILRNSAILTQGNVTSEDSFVTLSTCVSGNDYRARFVVIGCLAEIEPVYQEDEVGESTTEVE
jgi:sortase B